MFPSLDRARRGCRAKRSPLVARYNERGGDASMCETCRRLLALLRMLERSAAPFGDTGADAALDAWFGRRSPLFPLPPPLGVEEVPFGA
jgi:hypothetical protein